MLQKLCSLSKKQFRQKSSKNRKTSSNKNMQDLLLDKENSQNQLNETSKLTYFDYLKNKEGEINSKFYKFTKEKRKIDQINPIQLKKSMDTDFNTFFSARKLNIKNINFYLSILNSQNKNKEIIYQVETFLPTINLIPSSSTIYYYLDAMNQIDDPKIAQKIKTFVNLESSLEYIDNKLIISYLKIFTRKGNSLEARKLIELLNNRGYVINQIMITELLHGFQLEKDHETCWEIWYNDIKKQNIIADHILYSKMLNIAKITNDVEKGIQIWRQMDKEMGVIDDVILQTDYILLLGQRKEYAQQGIQMQEILKDKKIRPTSTTIVALFRCISEIGDIEGLQKYLNELKVLRSKLKEDRLRDKSTKFIPDDEQDINFKLNSLIIRTYARCFKKSREIINEDQAEVLSNDGYQIFEFCRKNGQTIDTTLVNSVINLQLRSGKLIEIEDRLLPLFKRHNIEWDAYTYEQLLKLYNVRKDSDMIEKIKIKLNDNKVKMNFFILNEFLENAIYSADSEKILQFLRYFIEKNWIPNYSLLRSISKAENMSREIFDLLKSSPWPKQQNIKDNKYVGSRTSKTYGNTNFRDEINKNDNKFRQIKQSKILDNNKSKNSFKKYNFLK